MNPYETLPETAFWRPSVADLSMFEISGLWKPKFAIRPEDPIATAGSCFAQHIGAHLRKRNYDWLVCEPPPRGMSEASARAFGYDLFSCRTGNIYTTSLLRQWTAWALGEATPPDDVWETSSRHYDPFRPTIEPDGFVSVEEMRRSREESLKALRECMGRASCLIFTLGLTESWIDVENGCEYPICPGVAAGEFDPARHRFVNQGFSTVRQNLAESIAMMRNINPGLRILLTVSPVPLTATYSGRHVLVATTASKSVLRAVADDLARDDALTDYFPSYEIVCNPAFKGVFFAPNQRQIAAHGVSFVMEHFFSALEGGATPPPVATAPTARRPSVEVCDEELLDAFRVKT